MHFTQSYKLHYDACIGQVLTIMPELDDEPGRNLPPSVKLGKGERGGKVGTFPHIWTILYNFLIILPEHQPIKPKVLLQKHNLQK